MYAIRSYYDMNTEKPYSYPDTKGKFGIYGGKYVPETLMNAIAELEKMYLQTKDDPEFLAELGNLLTEYNGRPTPLTFAGRLTDRYGKARITSYNVCYTKLLRLTYKEMGDTNKEIETLKKIARPAAKIVGLPRPVARYPLRGFGREPGLR